MKDKNLLRNFLLLLILPLCLKTAFAQTKIGEANGRYYGGTGQTEVDDLIKQLKQNPENTGLIVIHSGKAREMLGNILAFNSIVEFKAKFHSVKMDRISFAVIEGKDALFMEFWIIPKGGKKPQVQEIEIKLDNLKTKYFYANMCTSCFSGPSLEAFADALKNNPTYQGLIVVHDSSLYAGNQEKEWLVKHFNLNSNQITVELGKSYGIQHAVLDLYIVPQNPNGSTKIR